MLCISPLMLTTPLQSFHLWNFQLIFWNPYYDSDTNQSWYWLPQNNCNNLLHKATWMAHQTVKYWALNNGLNSMHSVIKYAGMPNVNANPPPMSNLNETPRREGKSCYLIVTRVLFICSTLIATAKYFSLLENQALIYPPSW